MTRHIIAPAIAVITTAIAVALIVPVSIVPDGINWIIPGVGGYHWEINW